MSKLYAAIATLLIGLALGAGHAQAQQNVICRGTLGPSPGITVNNVIVPSNARCTLISVRVTGNVTAQPESMLILVATEVSGNISVGAGASLEIYTPARDPLLRRILWAAAYWPSSPPAS